MTSYAGDEFIGFTVSREEKQALKDLARERNVPMSDILRKLLAGELETSGVKLSTSEENRGDPLPFEEKTLVVTEK